MDFLKETYIVKSFRSIDDINWNAVPVANISHFGWSTKPNFKSYAQIAFVCGYGFFVKLTSIEKNPWVTHFKDGEAVYLDSALEAFFIFNEEGYVNFENNSLGVRLQGFGPSRSNRINIIESIGGFDVKSNKTNAEWSVVIDVPFTKLNLVYKHLDLSLIKSGFKFYGNFYKTGLNPINKEEHYVMWNNIESLNPDFHRPEQFGELIIE